MRTVWPLAPLGEVATIERSSVAPEAIAPGTMYVGLEHITSAGHFEGHDYVAAGELLSNKFRFTSDHVLYGKLRPYLSKIAAPSFDGVCSTDILPICPGKRLDRRFLLHFLRQPSQVAEAASLATGANLPRLSPKVLSNVPIPLPLIDEQRRVAAVLDEADELRAKRQASVAVLDSLSESVFLDMFGHPVSNRRGWEFVKLADLGALDRGVSRHRPRNDPVLLGGVHPLIQTGDVTRSGGYITRFTSTYSDFGLQQSKMWPAGTLCITIAANIARTGILTFDSCFPDSVVGFTASERATVQYVRAVLLFHQPRLENAAPEFAQKNINLQILRELRVPCPPKHLQTQFTEVIERGRAASEMMIRSSKDLDALFASLQQRAFAGQL